MLSENINVLHRLAENLLIHEILDSVQIEAIVNGKKTAPDAVSHSSKKKSKTPKPELKNAPVNSHNTDRKSARTKKNKKSQSAIAASKQKQIHFGK